MSELLHNWALDGTIPTRPAEYPLLHALKYLQQYAIDVAYVPPQQAH
jgi:hypothetical protein